MSAKRPVTKTAFNIVLIGVVIYLSLWGFTIHSMKKAKNKTYEAISKIQLNCVEGTSQEIHPWSTGGYTISCRNDAHINGEWQAWKHSQLSIKGQYIHGNKHGNWVYYDQGGAISREVQYEEGVEINGNPYLTQ